MRPNEHIQRDDIRTSQVSLWKLRLRKLLDGRLGVVVAVLVVVTLAGGVATYTAHVNPESTTDERIVAKWETSGAFDHGATVTQPNPLFPVGAELQNRSVYFSTVSPVMNGTYTFSYRSTGSGEVTTTIDLSLVMRSIEETRDGRTVRWETSRQLSDPGTVTIAPGTKVRVPFSFNASEITNEYERINEQLGDSGTTTETVVRATVDLEGTVNGKSVDRQQVHTLPVTLEGNTYRVNPAEAPRQQFETTRTVTQPQTYSPLRSVGGPLLLAFALAGLVGVYVAQSDDYLELTRAEREWLDYRDERKEFDEWITSFRLPDEAFDRPQAEASSLGDLVDFAIDTDNGVIESPGGTTYSVLEGEFRYVYTAPERRSLGEGGSAESGEEDGGVPSPTVDSGDEDGDAEANAE